MAETTTTTDGTSNENLNNTTGCYLGSVDLEVIVTEFYEDKAADEFLMEVYIADIDGYDYIYFCQLGLRSYARIIDPQNNDDDQVTSVDFLFKDSLKLYAGIFYVFKFVTSASGESNEEVLELVYEDAGNFVLPAANNGCISLELYYAASANVLSTLDFVQLGDNCDKTAPLADPAYSIAKYTQPNATLSLPESGMSMSRKLEASANLPYAEFSVTVNGFSGNDWELNEQSLALPNDAGCVSQDETDGDGDGIYDCLEDETTDRYFGMNLYDWGARPEQVDLFLEMDYIACSNSGDHRTEPTRAVLDKVTATMNSYQLNEYPVRLHIDTGDLFDDNDSDTEDYNLGGGNNFVPTIAHLSNYWGITIDSRISVEKRQLFYDTKTSNFALARKQLFYYMLIAETTSESGDVGSYSGIAEVFGNDALVAIGGIDPDPNDVLNGSKINYPCNDIDENLVYAKYFQNYQANTIFHEFGHNLNLLHGGGELANYKPNYFSSMNYIYGAHGIPDDTAPERFTNSYYYQMDCTGDSVVERNAAGELTGVVYSNDIDSEDQYPGVYNNSLADFNIGFSSNEQPYIDETSVSETFTLSGGTTVDIDYNCNGTFDNGSYVYNVNGDSDINGDEIYGTLSDNDDFDTIGLVFAGGLVDKTATIQAFDPHWDVAEDVDNNGLAFVTAAEDMANGVMVFKQLSIVNSAQATTEPRQRIFSDHQPHVAKEDEIAFFQRARGNLIKLDHEQLHHADTELSWYGTMLLWVKRLFGF